MTIAKHNFPVQNVDGIIARAAAVYEHQGLKFTELRRLVLEVLAEHQTPVGAYTIIRILEGRYRKLSPISVYRALNSLMKMGIARKVKTQNAYFVADSMWMRTKPANERRIYLICEVCNRVAEVACPGVHELIEQASAAASFKMSVTSIEVSGICDTCRPGKSKVDAPVLLRPRSQSNGARRPEIPARSGR